MIYSSCNLSSSFFIHLGIPDNCSADLEEEVLFIAEPVYPPFDDFDFVGDTFDDAGVERPAAVAMILGARPSTVVPSASTPMRLRIARLYHYRKKRNA